MQILSNEQRRRDGNFVWSAASVLRRATWRSRMAGRGNGRQQRGPVDQHLLHSGSDVDEHLVAENGTLVAATTTSALRPRRGISRVARQSVGHLLRYAIRFNNPTSPSRSRATGESTSATPTSPTTKLALPRESELSEPEQWNAPAREKSGFSDVRAILPMAGLATRAVQKMMGGNEHFGSGLNPDLCDPRSQRHRQQ